MKFFLAVLLLVAVTASTVEEKYLDIENFDDVILEKFRIGKIFKGIGRGIKNVAKGVGSAFKKLAGHVKKGINWLKQHNLWDPIISTVNSFGSKIAIGFCSKYLTPMVCEPAVGFIFDKILK